MPSSEHNNPRVSPEIADLETQTTRNRINRGHLLALSAILMMPLAMFAPKGLAVLFIATTLAVLVWYRFHHVPVRWPPAFLVLPIIVFIAYGALSSVWSPTPLVSLKTSVILGLTTFGGLILISCAAALDSAEKSVLSRALVFGILVTLVLFGIEKQTDSSIWRWIMAIKAGVAEIPKPPLQLVIYNPAMSVGALFIWPLLLYWPSERRLLTLTGVMLVALIVFWSEADTPALAILFGLLAAAALWRRRAVMRAIVGGGVIILMFAAPLIPGQLPATNTIGDELPFLSNSALHRILIWKVAARHIAEDPVAGLGMDTTRSLYGKETKVTIKYPPAETGVPLTDAKFEPIPLHPHNSILQIWLELGGIGIAGLAWIVVAMIRMTGHRRKQAPSVIPIIMGFYVSSLVITSLSFGAWQSWWVATLWLAATLLVAQLPPTEQQSSG